MEPEFFLFLDERYEPAIHPTRIIVSAIVTEQGRWKGQRASGIRNSRTFRDIKMLCELLVQTSGFGVVMYAEAEFPGGIIHSTDDIPKMARNDNVWSIMGVCIVARVLRCLSDSVSKLGIIDIYHDPKSLTSEHSIAFQDGIRKLQQKAKDITGSNFSIRQIEQISKAEKKTAPSIFQRGVMMADHLCGNAARLISGANMSDIILCENVSTTIKNQLALFDALART